MNILPRPGEISSVEPGFSLRVLIRDIAKSIYLALGGNPDIGHTKDLPSPRIELEKDAVAADTLVSFAPKRPYYLTTVWITNSMEPLIDVGHTVILSKSLEYINEEVLKPGQIIVYAPNSGSRTIIHSIIGVGKDNEGWFCRCQGLNNPVPDREKIRMHQIKAVYCGVIPTKVHGGLAAREGD